MPRADPKILGQNDIGPEEILGRILDRERKGQPLYARIVQLEEPNLYSAARLRFGSWRRALECAGYDPDTVRRYRTWNRQRIIALIHRRAMEGASLRRKEVDRKERGLVTAVYKLFGSWQQALEAAGLNAEAFCAQPRWDRQQILEAILLRAVKRQALGSTTVKPTSLKTAAVAEFGSWSAALEAAGLDPKANMGFAARKSNTESNAFRNRDDVKRAILQRHALGYDCDYGSICKQDRRLFHAIRRHFGSVGRAMRYAGIAPTEADG